MAGTNRTEGQRGAVFTVRLPVAPLPVAQSSAAQSHPALLPGDEYSTGEDVS